MKKRMLSDVRRADPFFAREVEKYPYPLPSREYVLQTLMQQGVPMTLSQLCGALDVDQEEKNDFERRLRAMSHSGQLVFNRRGAYLLPEKADLIRGKVAAHPDGFGFLLRDDRQADIFLGPRTMLEVLNGDRVLVRIAGQDRKGRDEGKVVEILERANQKIVGRVLDQHGVLVVVPEDRRFVQDILVISGGKRARPGQVVCVQLLVQPTRQTRPAGKVIEILGNYDDPGMEIEIALRKHDMPFEFSATAKTQARTLPRGVRKKDLIEREDITGLPLVTIDGETARDFDDAVYCEKQGRGFRLLVAIADVSYYVQPHDALDDDARERGNSVYFPRRVIPMLPEKLSNGLCSLVPEEKRLCMVCDMAVSLSGEVRQYRFYPAVMYSHARLTYTQVAAALYEKQPEQRKALATLLPALENLDQVFRALLKARHKRGAIEFESAETRMIFDEHGKIERIVPEVRNDAHRLIEECMLAANVCASDYLQAHQQPALYRCHEGPTEDKLAKLREHLGSLGLTLGGGDEPQPGHYARLLETIRERPDALLLQTAMLRSLRQAVYSPDNAGHFGLAYDAYTHFTSPIRRYPDLLVHRAIRAVLQGAAYHEADWDAIALHCSATERRADEASREVESWLKCYYMQDKVGEEFTGSVSSVVPFGLFVALDDIFIEGLIHISDLGSDYFHFDDVRHELVGGRTGLIYRMAQRVTVQVVRVDLESSKIDFRLLEANDASAAIPRLSADDDGRGKAVKQRFENVIHSKGAEAATAVKKKHKNAAETTKSAHGNKNRNRKKAARP